MARRPNYGQQRAEISRGKQTKAEQKQKDRDEAVARRKAERDGEPLPDPAVNSPGIDSPATDEKAEP